MSRFLVDGLLVSNQSLNSSYYLLEISLPQEVATQWQVRAGMFVQVGGTIPHVLLRRPISIAYFLPETAILGLLVQRVGKATNFWRGLAVGSKLSLLGPLGRSFNTSPHFVGERPLLVAGGVGVAPIRMLAEELAASGIRPTIFYGARTAELLTFDEELRSFGDLYIATEDGSQGEKGYVTSLAGWQSDSYSSVFTCGPRAMMQAVMALARERELPCQVSLENSMACGIGVCLCCVEPTTSGNRCVCTEGPVFNAEELLF